MYQYSIIATVEPHTPFCFTVFFYFTLQLRKKNESSRLQQTCWWVISRPLIVESCWCCRFKNLLPVLSDRPFGTVVLNERDRLPLSVSFLQREQRPGRSLQNFLSNFRVIFRINGSVSDTVKLTTTDADEPSP